MGSGTYRQLCWSRAAARGCPGSIPMARSNAQSHRPAQAGPCPSSLVWGAVESRPAVGVLQSGVGLDFRLGAGWRGRLWHHLLVKSCFLLFPTEEFLLSLQNNSVSPSESLRASEKHRSSTDYSIDSKKRKAEEKDSMSRYVSAGSGCGWCAGSCQGTWQHTFRQDFGWEKANFG